MLGQVASHASERYFILKSIIVDNLYGVDIMEEAVEICKLRLFLKLVAQLESYDQIEPLPDVDFNVRAGNTLVGFASFEEVENALSFDLRKLPELPKIKERAEIADRAFRRFREMQTEHGMDAGKFADAKAELRRRIDELRDELDEYLAGDYGVKVDDEKAYRQWRESHQPFHWFVEFYGIMDSGGFDVVIGNPPYVEYRNIIKTYKIKDYITESCSNLYAFVLERNAGIVASLGRSGMIVPHSAICTDRMGPVQKFLVSNDTMLWVSSYDIRPAKLFIGVDQRLAIYLMASGVPRAVRGIFSSRYHRWSEQLRTTLLPSIEYVNTAISIIPYSVPKIHSRIEERLLEKLIANQPLKQSFQKRYSSNSKGSTVYQGNCIITVRLPIG